MSLGPSPYTSERVKCLHLWLRTRSGCRYFFLGPELSVDKSEESNNKVLAGTGTEGTERLERHKGSWGEVQKKQGSDDPKWIFTVNKRVNSPEQCDEKNDLGWGVGERTETDFSKDWHPRHCDRETPQRKWTSRLQLVRGWHTSRTELSPCVSTSQWVAGKSSEQNHSLLLRAFPYSLSVSRVSCHTTHRKTNFFSSTLII